MIWDIGLWLMEINEIAILITNPMMQMQKLAELNGNALSKLFQVNDRFSVVMAMNSDHYPFSLLDIPSVTIVQNLEEELKINDESDIKENLDYERMQEVVKCILRVAFELE